LIIHQRLPFNVVDTIPAWASINTSLSPGNQACSAFTTFFDATMDDLQKLSIDSVKGYVLGLSEQRALPMRHCFAQLVFPPWDTNGAMVGYRL
jgi:hypothetical protein